MNQELKIWMNGKLVPQAEAVLPVNSAAVFYATNLGVPMLLAVAAIAFFSYGQHVAK